MSSACTLLGLPGKALIIIPGLSSCSNGNLRDSCLLQGRYTCERHQKGAFDDGKLWHYHRNSYDYWFEGLVGCHINANLGIGDDFHARFLFVYFQ